MMVNLPCLMESCSNFLRPTCSYTECQLSFLTGSCPTERTTASYSSCLYFDFTDLFVSQDTDIPWTLYLVSRSWSLCWCSTFCTPSLSGFFPEPCSISEYSETQQGSGFRFVINRFALCCKCFLFDRMFYVHQHLFRIINSSLSQDCIDYS